MSPERLPFRSKSITSVSPLDWNEESTISESNVASAGKTVSPTAEPTLPPLRNLSEFDPASILILPI